MNKIFYCFCLLLAVSCTSSTNINEEQANVVGDTSGTEIEKKLKSQLNEYLVAINGGDPDKAINYIYPDVFVYMQQQYPNDFSIERIKDEMREPVRKMKKLVEQKRVAYDFEIGDFTRKIDLGKDKIYTMIVSINGKMGLNKHTLGQEIISISNNGGKDWKFMELKNEMVKPILLMKFSSSTVDKVLKE